LRHLGRVLPKLLQQGAHREAEHARIPGEVAHLQKLFGDLARRLLDEAAHREGAVARQGLAPLDVAERGFRSARSDPEGHQQAGFRHVDGLLAGGPERLLVPDDVIGRQDQQDGVVAMLALRPQRRERDRRRRVAALGLEQKRRRAGQRDLRQIFDRPCRNRRCWSRSPVAQRRPGWRLWLPSSEAANARPAAA